MHKQYKQICPQPKRRLYHREQPRKVIEDYRAKPHPINIYGKAISSAGMPPAMSKNWAHHSEVNYSYSDGAEWIELDWNWDWYPAIRIRRRRKGATNDLTTDRNHKCREETRLKTKRIRQTPKHNLKVLKNTHIYHHSNPCFIITSPLRHGNMAIQKKRKMENEWKTKQATEVKKNVKKMMIISIS